MYKLLIVEDEEIIRNTLPVIIDWNSIGFEVAGSVENGVIALETMEQKAVDVVLTDIRMPEMNGLELACEVKMRYPDVKTILLSAYSEFAYAKKGIDYGVYGYLLKSDDEEEMKNYFINLKEVMDYQNKLTIKDENNSFDNRSSTGNEYNRKLIEKVMDFIKQNYFRDISLKDAARCVNVHPVYLSRLFSQETKSTFIDFLTEIRMNMAKELLMNIDLKVYEISQSVGYQKPRYFSELFKKHTGVTPLEFREKYKSDDIKEGR